MADRDLHFSAVFSDCGTYRHLLRSWWNSSRPTLGVIALNPSEAGRVVVDGVVRGDPSARKIAGFADRLGFGGFVLGNCFDYIATKPLALKRAGYPRSAECDAWLRTVVQEGNGNVLCAWGTNARGLSRPGEVLALLGSLGVNPKALKITDDGIPWHPLMLPYTCSLLEL